MSLPSDHGLDLKEPDNSLVAPHRRLVVMFDGTWNERENLTNVARMFEAIDDYKPDGYVKIDPLTYKGPEPVQLVKYLKGVGTNVVGHLSGGAVGLGLSDIIKAAYLWLSQNYIEGDEIFVFGFSRGAYSARSLVSLIHRCGGVLELNMAHGDPASRGAMDEHAARLVFKDPDPARTSRLLRAAYDLHTKFQHTDEYARKMKGFGDKYCQPVKIKMLGVWDTVGSVGLRCKNKFLDRNFPWSSSHYDLIHDQELPCIVENAYHALAIDEHREPFLPTLWESWTPWDDTTKLGNKEVKQVWFVGSHCNVGGGATAIDEDGDEDPDDLWQYSYVWMQNKAYALGLRLSWLYTPLGFRTPGADDDAAKTEVPRRISKTTPQDSYKQMLRLPFMKEGIYCKLHNPINRPVVGSMGSSLHWSVAERIEQDPTYRPVSLRIDPKDENSKCFTKIDWIPLSKKTCSCIKDASDDPSERVTATHQPTISKDL